MAKNSTALPLRNISPDSGIEYVTFAVCRKTFERQQMCAETMRDTNVIDTALFQTGVAFQ